MAELRIELLGGFSVASRGRAIPEEVWQRRKTAALFKLLALAPRHRLHREQVMDALWPELPPAARRRTFARLSTTRVTLCQARRVRA
jgi:DNA-binding SARP family transcriptional activator